MKKLVVLLIFLIIFISSCKQDKNLSPENEIKYNPLSEQKIRLHNIELESKNLMQTNTPLSKENSYIVFFKDEPLIKSKNLPLLSPEIETLQLDKEKEFNIKGMKVVKKFRNSVNAFTIEANKKQVEELKKDKSISDIIPNYEIKMNLDSSVNSIHADDVWTLQDIHGNNITGEGITIAIIDTGVDYTHPDLGGCLGINCKVVGGYDFINNDYDPMDDHGHGTHCAAISAGNGTLNGVAPGAKIYSLKVLNDTGTGYLDDLLSALDYVTDLNQNGIPLEDENDSVDIISMSLGFAGGNPDDQLSLAVDSLVDQGIITVISAGNSGPDTFSISSPGNSRKAITVGAINNEDNQIAQFSSRGPTLSSDLVIKPDIVAPGVNICAARYDGSFPSNTCIDSRHIGLSGTSMAAPHVTGVAALILQAHPNWSPDLIKSSIMSTALNLGYNGTSQGAGLINAFNSVDINNTNSKVLEPKISFGFIDESNFTPITKNFTLINPSNEQRTYYLSYSSENCITLDFPEEIILESNSNETIFIILNIESGCSNDLTEGKIYITSSSNEEMNVPFILYLSKLFELNVRYKQENLDFPPILVILNSEDQSYYAGGFVFGDENGEANLTLLSDTSKNYDFFLFTGNTEITSNYTIDNYSFINSISNITLTTKDEINVTQENKVTLDATNATISVNYNPLLPNGESYMKTKTFKSSGGIVFKNIGGVSFPMGHNTTYPNYGVYYSNITFWTNKIPSQYKLDYFGLALDNQNLYIIRDRIGNPENSIIKSNDPSSFIQKQLYFPILQSIDLASINVLGRLYSNMSPEYYTATDMYLEYFTPFDLYNISTDLPLIMYMTPKEEDYFLEDISINLLNSSRPYFQCSDTLCFTAAILSMSNLNNINENELLYIARLRNINLNIPLPEKLYSSTNYPYLQLKPIFIVNKHKSEPGILNLDTFILNQGGDLTSSLLGVIYYFYQENVTVEMMTYNWATSNLYINGTNSSIYSSFPNLRYLDLTKPMTVEQFSVGLNTELDSTFYNTSSKFYFDPNLPDNEPPILIDVDVISGFFPSNILSLPNGRFRFTIADENLENVSLRIDNQEIPLTTFGSPYSVTPPTKIFYEQQNSGFDANLSSFVYTQKPYHEVLINATDSSGNWVVSKLFINMNITYLNNYINLTPGFNFISLPPTNALINPSSLSPDLVLGYDPQNNDWLINYKNVNEIGYFSNCKGYIIRSNEYQNYFIPTQTQPILCPQLTQNSWNLVGTIIEGTAQQIYGAGQYTVMEWDGLNYIDISSQSLRLGKAYWIYPGIPQTSPPKLQ